MVIPCNLQNIRKPFSIWVKFVQSAECTLRGVPPSSLSRFPHWQESNFCGKETAYFALPKSSQWRRSWPLRRCCNGTLTRNYRRGATGEPVWPAWPAWFWGQFRVAQPVPGISMYQNLSEKKLFDEYEHISLSFDLVKVLDNTKLGQCLCHHQKHCYCLLFFSPMARAEGG